MSVTISPADKARLLNLAADLTAGGPLQPGAPQALNRLAGDFGLLYGEALDIVSKHGWPRADSMRRAAGLLLHPAKNYHDAPSPRVVKPVQVPHPGPEKTQGWPEPKGPAVVTHHKSAQSEEQAVTKNYDVVETIDDLLAIAGSDTSSKRVQRAAASIYEKVKVLREMVQEEDDKREARARVARLEKELAKARAELRGEARITPEAQGPTAQAIRAWAAENHVDCPKTGRIPADVRAQLDAAIDAAAS
jgi:hypothetical protein